MGESPDVVFKMGQSNPNDPEYMFHCPGCGCSHWFKTTGDKPCWTFNGDMVKPTVKPSIKTQHGKNIVCHFIITDGQIKYCDDSTHDLKGQTVPMVPM